ncbi:MAG: tRNA pseudouridine(55) synthase TruB [Chloroflexota bacterium]|nr:tRNA pseudouridine(55) synthase TruB [Chloroflexota bacterium]
MTAGAVRVNGILDLYKPRGITSMEAVRQVRRLTGQKGVGHGGTLDPLAEGVLPICFGLATRVMEYLIQGTKLYRMTVRLGVATDTYDSEGQVVSSADASAVTEQRLDQSLDSFRGSFLQTPPMFSALKSGGRRLYELARAGVEVERQPRQVQVSRLLLLDVDLPNATMEVECGRGIYLRSLAHDIGQALGCGAHLTSLVRLRAGPFDLEHSVSMQRLEQACQQGAWQELLVSLDYAMLSMKAVKVNTAAERFIRNGQPVSLGAHGHYAQHMESYRVYTQRGHFLGVVRLDKGRGLWMPHKLFVLDTPSPYAP